LFWKTAGGDDQQTMPVTVFSEELRLHSSRLEARGNRPLRTNSRRFRQKRVTVS